MPFEEATSVLSSDRKQKALGDHGPLSKIRVIFEDGSLIFDGMFWFKLICFKLVLGKAKLKRVKPYQEYSSNRLTSSGNHPSLG